jgi:transposase
MELHTIGIDLGKTVFHLVGLNLRGEVVVRKKFSRLQLLRFTVNRQVELIGMEACGGSHFLGRARNASWVDPRPLQSPRRRCSQLDLQSRIGCASAG